MQKTKMTALELEDAYTYFSNPLCEMFIEVELPESAQRKFDQEYSQATVGYPLPVNRYTSPYFLLQPDADKWGVELRLYFNENGLLPDFLNEISTGNNRQGYEEFSRRINNNELIKYLFGRGFILGEQDITRFH